MNENRAVMTNKESLMQPDTDTLILTPIVDIYENDEEILLHAEMPGVTKDGITVNIDNGSLEITGMRKVETSGATSWQEFGDVLYKRVFSVPQTIDTSKVNAELKEGVLQLHLPIAETAKPRKIEIHTAH
jgi:HSP20 family molecular chaperone IbpA